MSERGEVLIVRHYEPDTMRYRVRIKRADPRALISRELAAQIAADECEPFATWTDPDVITLTDDYGQKFIYRVGAYDPVEQAYEMEWPD